MAEKPLRLASQPGGSPGGDAEQLRRLAAARRITGILDRRPWGELRRFFEHEKRVRPSDPQTVHRGAAWRVSAVPVGQRGLHVERAVLERDGGIRRGEVHGGRELAVVERQSRLDQASEAGGLLGMADVGLHRTDGAEPPALRVETKGSRERLNLDRVAGGSAGSVAFNVADGVGLHLSGFQGLDDCTRLTDGAGGGVADLAGTVIRHRAAFDDGVDVIAVVECGGDRLQQDSGHTAAEDCPDARGVERPAMPVL